VTPSLQPVREADMPPSGSSASVPVACPLQNVSPELHQYIHGLEQRIVELEAKTLRFENAIHGLGNFIFTSSQGKMILMALPKAAQEKLREVFPQG
jgi:hypothetical protein